MFIFLTEIKCNDTIVVQNLVQSLHFESFEMVPASRKVGGLLLAWNSNCSLNVVFLSKFIINCLLFYGADNVPWQLNLVYGPPTYHMRRSFWESLDEIGRPFSRPWLVIGDFNIVLTSEDKMGEGYRRIKQWGITKGG